MTADVKKKKGTVFNIETYAVYDGPGIRSIVFLKGCPLKCLWCQNPEGQDPRPQLAFFSDNCTGCLGCISVCPSGAIKKAGEKVAMNWNRCQRSFKCVEVCPNEARKVMGKLVTAEEVVEEVAKDLPFFKRSGGGVTLGGGEPLMQPDFASEILKLCKERNINTTIETSGFAKPDDFMKVIKYADFIFFDIKHMDSAKHKVGVGVGNEIILKNLKNIPEDRTVVVRIPVVLGYNDSEENILNTAKFVKKLNRVQKIELLPYNKLGVLKYKRIGKRYHLPDVESPTQEQMKRLKDLVEASGTACEIV